MRSKRHSIDPLHSEAPRPLMKLGAQAPRPFYARFHVEERSPTQKCWIHEARRDGGGAEEVALWELRRLLDEAYGHNVEVHQFLKKGSSFLEADLHMAGLSLQRELVPSLKAWRFSQKGPPPPHLQEEYQISSEAALAWLASWSTSRRLERHRNASRCLLRQLLLKCLSEEDARDLVLQCPEGDVLQLCDGYTEADECCPHVYGIYDRISRCTAGAIDMLVELAVLLASQASALRAVRAWWTAWVPAVACRFPRKVTERFLSDPLEAKPDHLTCGGNRKRRVDCDYKQAVVMGAMTKRRAPTPGAFAAASGDIARTTASSWSPILLGQYRAACMLQFAESSVVGLAYDASRLGQPKEETLMTAVCDPLQGIAAWLPPQELIGGLGFVGGRWSHVASTG